MVVGDVLVCMGLCDLYGCYLCVVVVDDGWFFV